jgi:hypothetical protein
MEVSPQEPMFRSIFLIQVFLFFKYNLESESDESFFDASFFAPSTNNFIFDSALYDYSKDKKAT